MVIKMKETKGEKIFDVINIVMLTLIAAVTLCPLVYIFAASLSSGDAYARGAVMLWPVEATTAAYKEILNDSSVWTAYANTIFYTVAGTAVNLLLTFMGAYPLSKKYLPGAKWIMKFVVLTMWFQPGMIPFYLTIKEYGLLNSRMSIIIGFAISAYNMMLMKNFFMSVPDSLEEAAKLDGANDWYILWKIFLPLSVPAVATIGLFYGVSRWNGYFWAMILLKDDVKIPLQVLLKRLIIEASARSEYVTLNQEQKFSSETIIYATIVISILPVMAVYPYIQKYFIKGALIGAVKG